MLRIGSRDSRPRAAHDAGLEEHLGSAWARGAVAGEALGTGRLAERALEVGYRAALGVPGRADAAEVRRAQGRRQAEHQAAAAPAAEVPEELGGLLALLDGLPPRQRPVLTTSELLESSGTTATPGLSFGTTRSTMSVQAAGQVENARTAPVSITVTWSGRGHPTARRG